MKRLLIAFLILSAGATVFRGFQNSTARLERTAKANETAWQAQIQLVAQTRMEHVRLEQNVRDSERELKEARQAESAYSSSAILIPEPGQHLSPAQREKSLAELGFNWDTTGDYVVVSKNTLQHIRLDGMKGMKLSDVASQVLAITPEERAAINSMTEQVSADYKNWAETNMQRVTPSGDVVAKYTLPPDPQFSQSLSNMFAGAVISTLGSERGQLLLDYSRSWMVAMDMRSYVNPPAPTTMTISRYGSGADYHLRVEVNQGGNTMGTDVSPWQPFPRAFQPLFPGGWRDLAVREGFQLPKQFQKVSAAK